ncbi:MAG TPA: VC0807 family protein [Candidatus Binataceae bacterium]|nr:VC0807 family protein [Candidatus Binataceae bacterium]
MAAIPSSLAMPPEPAGGGFSFTQMLPTLVFDVALPIIAFNVLTRYGVSTLWALVAGGVFPAANNVRAWLTTGRLEPVGIIVMTFLAVGTAASLISGSVFFALVKDSFLTATFGFICLGSLVIGRPLLFVIMRQFVAGDDPERIAWWNGLWEIPPFRRAQRIVTGTWGVVYVLEALLRVAFALVLTPATVVAISPVMAFGVMILMIAWTRRYMLAFRQRRMRELEAQAAQASAAV